MSLKENFYTESLLLGTWHSWGGQKVLKLASKPDPLIYDHLFLPA
jgi:hypothetical protein